MTDDELERDLADLDPAGDIDRAPSEELLAQTLARPRSAGRARSRRRLRGRGLAVGFATLAVAGGAMAAVVHQLAEPSRPSFEAAPYLGHGDEFACSSFASQADAQAVLRADPSDPNELDAEDGLSEDHDGVACTALRGPKDLEPVRAIVAGLRCGPADTRSARCPQRWRVFGPSDYVRHETDEYDCDAFASQADAQAVLRYEPDDPDRLDGDGNGIACPDLPAPKDLARVVTRAPS